MIFIITIFYTLTFDVWEVHPPRIEVVGMVIEQKEHRRPRTDRWWPRKYYNPAG